MASDPQYDETFQPTPPPKRGMSTGAKVLIILLCIFGGLALICCGGIGYIVYKVRNAESKDPTVVKAVTKKIADIDIPAIFEPQRSIDISIWMQMKVVEYRTKNRDGMLTMMEMKVPNATEDDMQKSLNQQGQGQSQNERNLEIKKSDLKTFKIRGKSVEFRFAEAVDSKSKAAYRKVSGTFPGNDGGAVVLVLQLPEKDYKEAEIVKMLQSIK